MNQEYFDNIAIQLDKELEREAQIIVSTKEYIDNESGRLDKFKFLMKYYPNNVESLEEATTIATKLVDVFIKIVEKNDDFNTNMLAFVSLYNFLNIKKILEKIDSKIIELVGDVFDKQWEKAYFFDLLNALNSLEEKDFESLQKKYPSLEITYMCLAVIYLQKIFDYRVDRKEKKYTNLAYCFSKISGTLRMAIFYGYRYKDPVPFEITKCIITNHYNVYLPKLHIREYDELEAEYKAGADKNVSWIDFITDKSVYKDTLWNRRAVVIPGKLYNEIAIIISKMGNYMEQLEEQYDKLKVLQDERYRIIRDFSHTYENMQAIGLKEIANILIKSDDSQIKQCGRVILAEYGMKNSLKSEVNLLRLNFEDKQDDIVKLIRKGISYDKRDIAIDINNIFEEALKICLLRIIYSGNPRGEDQIAKVMYKRIKTRVGSMQEFVKNFESEILENKVSLRKFLKNVGINIEFNSDDNWNKLYFEKNKHAEVLIRSIFAELITNSFKYADLRNTISYTLKLNDNKYGILQMNRFVEVVEAESGVGLESKGEILKKLNGYQSYFVEKNMDEESFKALFLIDSQIFDLQEDGENGKGTFI